MAALRLQQRVGEREDKHSSYILHSHLPPFPLSAVSSLADRLSLGLHHILFIYIFLSGCSWGPNPRKHVKHLDGCLTHSGSSSVSLLILLLWLLEMLEGLVYRDQGSSLTPASFPRLALSWELLATSPGLAAILCLTLGLRQV